MTHKESETTEFKKSTAERREVCWSVCELVKTRLDKAGSA
jgi:hypothetical protein